MFTARSIVNTPDTARRTRVALAHIPRRGAVQLRARHPGTARVRSRAARDGNLHGAVLVCSPANANKTVVVRRSALALAGWQWHGRHDYIAYFGVSGVRTHLCWAVRCGTARRRRHGPPNRGIHTHSTNRSRFVLSTDHNSRSSVLYDEYGWTNFKEGNSNRELV